MCSQTHANNIGLQMLCWLDKEVPKQVLIHKASTVNTRLKKYKLK